MWVKEVIIVEKKVENSTFFNVKNVGKMVHFVKKCKEILAH